MLAWRERAGLELQRRIAHALTFATYGTLFAWLRLVRRYRIPEIRRVRREFAALLREGGGPILVCPNHLTLVDSLLAIWALAPAWRYFLRPRALAWNLPERRNVAGMGVVVRLVCYLGKCLLLVRQGPPEETRRVMEKVGYLMRRGEALMVFPEGGRSRKGRVDTEGFAYGVGRLVQEVPATRVLCLYLRGDGQETWSDLPRKGEVFRIALRPLQPSSPHSGLRAQRDIATQVVRALEEMEREHFAAGGRC